MARKTPYDESTAGRTRFAMGVLDTPELLAKFVALRGLPRDLIAIRDQGLRAEALDAGQSGAMAAGGAATSDVLVAFMRLRTDYKGIMDALPLVIGDLQAPEANARTETIERLERILVNEAVVAMRTVEKDGAKKKVAGPKTSQESVRAEIGRDAAGLLEVKEAHALLAERGITVAQLEKLKADAQALSGKLADRAVKKGTSKTATAEEHAAVRAQSEQWDRTSRVIQALAKQDAGAKALLQGTARK